jgi:hypothetical protein
MNAEHFVLLDKTAAGANMIRRYGWDPRRERLVDVTPHGHWRPATFTGGLRGTCLVAPILPNKGFLAYVEQFLASVLAKDDVEVTDNLAAYKVAGVGEAMRVTGASPLQAEGAAPHNRRPHSRHAMTTIGRRISDFSLAERRNFSPAPLCVRVSWKSSRPTFAGIEHSKKINPTVEVPT